MHLLEIAPQIFVDPKIISTITPPQRASESGSIVRAVVLDKVWTWISPHSPEELTAMIEMAEIAAAGPQEPTKTP